MLSHLVVQNGVTNAAVVETRLTAGDGGTFDADVVYFDPSSRARVILEVSIVTIGSDTSLGRGARTGLDGSMRSCGRGRVQRLLNEAGNNTIFTPIVMSACGAMGPSMVAFLKRAYGRAKDADKFLMSQQPALKYTWNTMVTSSFWDMRLSIACTQSSRTASSFTTTPSAMHLSINPSNEPTAERRTPTSSSCRSSRR